MPDHSEFAVPRKEYMPAPFWFWNDDLDPDELRRQVAEMDGHAIGGFFMHARMGRVTPYLGDRWMECIRACVDEAAARGMHAWIYDEDNWPSGYGGGIVNALGPEMLQPYLFCDEIDLARNDGPPPLLWDETEAVFGGRRDDAGEWAEIRRLERDDYRALHRGGRPDGVDRLLVFRREVHDRERFFCPECSTRGYVDILDAKVTRAFIDHVYETYARAVGDQFGRAVPGFFTDEPSYHELEWRLNALRLPWTKALPARFREVNGGDLLDQLPSLVTETGDWFRVRRDYYLCLALLFAENFTRPLAQWCEEHGARFTGHYIVEESMPGAAQCTGDPMLHYVEQHVPGIDHLGKDIDLAEFWSSARVLVKQPASVCHQFGQERIMIETFAGGGWDFGLAEQKWMGDWLYALGVNLLCQHAFHYSLRGYRKRDYPPSLSYQQPWWDVGGPLGTHFARLGWALTRGRRDPAVLVLHPLESRFGIHTIDGHPWPEDPLTDSFERITAELLARQVDFDYGDEELIARSGSVADGRFRVGAGAYPCVIVPHAETWRATTLDLLERFLDDGGAVFSIGPVATRADARASDRPATVLGRGTDLGPWDAADLPERMEQAVDAAVSRPFRVEGAERASIVHHYRVDENGSALFLASAARAPFDATVRIPGARSAARWDTVTGRSTAIPGTVDDDGAFAFSLPFADGLSHLVVPDPVETPGPPDPVLFGEVRERIPIAGPGDEASVRLSEPNVVLLDRCDLEFDRVPAQPDLFVLDANRRIQAYRAGVPGTARFRWESDVEIAGPELLIETPEAFTAIEFNGASVDAGANAPSWIDVHLRRVPLPGPVRVGTNEVIVRFAASAALELEPLYVAGDFSVRFRGEGEGGIAPVTCTPVDRLRIGDWSDQGLPFYAGGVTYELALPERSRGDGAWSVEIDAVRAAAAVRFAGATAPVELPWRPFAAAVPGEGGGAGGRAPVEITVYGSLRGFYGPHHLDHEDRIDCLGPHCFFEAEHRVAEYRFKPAGLLGEIAAVCRVVPNTTGGGSE